MTTETRKIKSISEILQQECKQRKSKEIKLDVYCDGTLYMIHKLSMYFRVPTNEYMIVLYTDSGCLVNTVLDLRRAESEYTFLFSMNDNVKQKTPVTVNSFFYIADESMAEQVGADGGYFGNKIAIMA